MDFIRGAIAQPVTVAVGVILLLMAGLVALGRIPIQMTPTVEDTIISVSTAWEGASPSEMEQEVIDKQEEKLQGLANLRALTSECRQGGGTIRLEFHTGTPMESAMREISDKLREVPEYPPDVDEPVIQATDFENRDFIAWMILGTTDPAFDVRSLQDFAEDRIKPALERIPGVSEVGVLGGWEREAQIRFDPVRLAQRGITPMELIRAIERTNRDVSAGEVPDAKSNVRVRTLSQYESVEDVERTVIQRTEAGPVLIGDVAEVIIAAKEPLTFVRSRGRSVIAINAQREIGSNVMEVMDRLQAEIARLGGPSGLLEAEARRLGLSGALTLEVVYDQTVYIDQALDLVQENIWIGGALAVATLFIFLRSMRSVLIIIISTPISVVGAIVAMVALGRTINVISLAGMAFAIGMVIDNAIVILENIFRHLEMGKAPGRAAYDGTREVWGAILAATLTNIIVFIPILLIEEEAGQLFRDISLAIVATAALSLVVCLAVVPAMAARMMRTVPKSMRHASGDDPRNRPPARHRNGPPSFPRRALAALTAPLRWLFRRIDALPDQLAAMIHWMSGSVLARLAVVAFLTAGSLIGSWLLMPPADYLPKGNRNLVFGLIIPPPGYNLEAQEAIGMRVEATIRPYWEAAAHPRGTPEYERAAASLPGVPTFDFATMSPGPMITPPPIDNYFFVAFDGIMFHGAVGTEEKAAVDVQALLNHATRSDVAPGVIAFAFQVPLFNLGGASGSAVKINFAGDDLGAVTRAAEAFQLALGSRYGFHTVQPKPGNFNIPGPELQIIPDRLRLAEVGMTPADLGAAVRAGGDGAIVGEYRIGGETIDLKLIASDAVARKYLEHIEDEPIATPIGRIVPLHSIAEVRRATSAPQINRVNRQRAVTLDFTAAPGTPLEAAVSEIDAMIADLRGRGIIPPEVITSFTGSASKLRSVRDALLGDGSLLGTMSSSLVLALLITYLLMCVLYQSFLYPLVIMFSVPLATLGGFAALAGVYRWSLADRYVPVQTLDVLTMLGFIILIGVVVNNAILLVHQTLNLMRGISDVPRPPAGGTGPASSTAPASTLPEIPGVGVPGLPGAGETLSPRCAVAESVRTRVRPILMSLFTSVIGMLPLVVSPGAGSELYRGLGAVVLGGLIVSTLFTLVLIPLLLGLVLEAKGWLALRLAAASAPLRGGGELAAK
jgi:HAE1 family hydrophobic/amphiphilic exporter-1